MRRMFGASLAAAGAGALGLLFWDPRGPVVKKADSAASLNLPDFAVPTQAEKLAVVHGSDRAKTVALALKALGGLESFVKAGDTVLLKVNAAFATPPMLGATTHPLLVSKMVELCLQAGAGRVIVADNPINDPAACFELTGIGPAAREAGARVALPQTGRFTSYTLPGGELIRRWPLFSEPLLQADKVIGLATVKDHHRSGASLAIKNWYGLLGGRRNIFHQQIHTILTELALMIRPTLVVLDGTQSMMSNGPTGGSLSDLRATDTMIAGTDQVAVDTLGAALLGKSPKDLPYLAKAEAAGAGTVDYHSLHLVEV